MDAITADIAEGTFSPTNLETLIPLFNAGIRWLAISLA
jgi:hypothetical protein